MEIAELVGLPHCDAEVQELAAELWDTGKIAPNATPEAALRQMGLPPDFDFMADRPLRYIHRRLPDADVYFVSNAGAFACDTNLPIYCADGQDCNAL